MKIERSAIVAAARSYLGTPYVHGGRVRGEGVDCVGLLICVARDLGIPHEPVPPYSREPSPGAYRALLAERMRSIPVLTAGHGDVLSFRFRVEQHLAVLAVDGERPTLIHAYEQVCRCVENGYARPWTQRVCSAWRFDVELISGF